MNENPLDPQRPQQGDEALTQPISNDYPGSYPDPASHDPQRGYVAPEQSPAVQPPAEQSPTTQLPPVEPTPTEPPTAQFPTYPATAPQVAGHPAGPYQGEQYRGDPYLGDQASQRPPWEAAAAAPAAKRKRRGGVAAAAVAGMLLVGGAGGFGGAALWNLASDDGSSSSATHSTVVDTGKQVAESGTEQSVAAKVLPSVVKIEVSGAAGSGSGSGVILSSDGEILTNNHVVEVAGDGGSITVVFNDGTRAEAEIVGTDALTDSALIKAKGRTDLAPADLGKSGNLVVGQKVVAIGAPYGLSATVTSGIVSALNRPVNVGSDGAGNATTYPAIQTDAAINPGNSGGPLVDMSGNVIGINSSIRTASDSSESESGSIGLGFAIPIDELLPIVDQMRAGDTPTHARLGISVGSSQTGDPIGATVASVTDKSTAAKAGLKKGDVITGVDDHLIEDADSLIATIRSYRPGDQVTVTWTRDGKEKSAQLTLDSDEGTLAANSSQDQGQSQPQDQQQSPFGDSNPYGSDPFGQFGR